MPRSSVTFGDGDVRMLKETGTHVAFIEVGSGGGGNSVKIEIKVDIRADE